MVTAMVQVSEPGKLPSLGSAGSSSRPSESEPTGWRIKLFQVEVEAGLFPIIVSSKDHRVIIRTHDPVRSNAGASPPFVYGPNLWSLAFSPFVASHCRIAYAPPVSGCQ